VVRQTLPDGHPPLGVDVSDVVVAKVEDLVGVGHDRGRVRGEHKLGAGFLRLVVTFGPESGKNMKLAKQIILVIASHCAWINKPGNN
jgi:hypothetical protein